MWHVSTSPVRVVDDYTPENPQRALYPFETPIADGWAIPDDYGNLRPVRSIPYHFTGETT